MSIRSLIREARLLLKQGLFESRRAFEPVPRPARTSSEFLALEERILLSATPLAAAAAPAEAPVEVSPTADQQILDVLADTILPDSATQIDSQNNGQTQSESADEEKSSEQSATTEQLREIIFVDAAVENIETVIADLQDVETQTQSVTREVVILDSEQDGIQQITAALRSTRQLDAIHIVSHGSNGEIHLGSTTLSTRTLAHYQSDISQWQHSVTKSGDILFYGCDLAASADGQSLMQEISLLCDCDVSASDDITGHQDLGGDWELEFATGKIEAHVAFSANFQSEWYSTLATAELNPTQDAHIDEGEEEDNYGN